MNYQETIDFLYAQLPVYQKEGKSALNYKLDKIRSFCRKLYKPQNEFKSIHVAGTNGKGSTSHMLASILQEQGYKVGLYTSPHLKNFTERIKINGEEVSQEFVIDFVQENLQIIQDLEISFFEMTVAMAFDYFAKEKVDYAVIEVGLGGQFDSTNIITPILSVITNISLDHQDILGDTLAKIAFEKAGIIKQNIPVVIGEYHKKTFSVFQEKALKENALLLPAFEIELSDNNFLPTYQLLNQRTVQQATTYLKDQQILEQEAIDKGIKNYIKNTNLKGRWQQLGEKPFIFCDTGHNEAGIQLIVQQLAKYTFDNLYIVIGVVNDKDISKVLTLLPKKAYYYYCQAKIPRALSAIELEVKAKNIGLKGEVILDVNEAINKAKQQAKATDFIYIGGSNFVIGEINEL